MNEESAGKEKPDIGPDQPTLPPKPASNSTDENTLAPSGPATNSAAPREFGDYLLEEEIARGGMGIVYRGRQKSLDREVAIKMILAGQFASQEEVDRFYTEATAAAKLDHPNIVPVYDVGDIDGHHFFSMKFVEGSDLAAKLVELRNDLPVAVEILRKVCEAVHHAHQRGVLHRDLKPGNILLDRNNEPYVTDLGLARRFNEDSRLTQTGAIIGTPSYMPPEQASGSADITTAADVYSLGAILYEILTGRPPFKASSPVETMMQVISEMPVRPSTTGTTDRGLESICMKCLAKDQNDRYESAADLSRDLERWFNGEPLSVRSASLANVTKFWLKQNFGSAIWAIAIGPVMGIVSGLSLWYSTIGMNTSGIRDVYEKLPSAQVPFSPSAFTIPRIAQAPLVILFLLSIVFVGYLTARFVKPKHRGADLAAGTIVGFIASLAAFMFALGPLCVLTSLKYNDLKYAVQIAVAENDETPDWVLEQYPELKGFSQVEQVKLLAQKTESDHFFQIPSGIWTGAFVSLAIYFLPCLFETFVAGPIFRRKERWYRELLAYLEITFPVVTLMIVFTLAVITWLILGGCGFRWTIRLAVLLLLISVAVIAGRMRWQVPLRLAIQTAFAVSFVWFFATDFPSIPGVADCNGRIANARRAVRENPDSYLAQARFVGTYITYSEMLWQNDRRSESLVLIDSAIEKSDQLAEMVADGKLDSPKDELTGQLLLGSRMSKIRLLSQMGRVTEASLLLDEVETMFPGSPVVPQFKKLIQEAREKK